MTPEARAVLPTVNAVTLALLSVPANRHLASFQQHAIVRLEAID